MSLPCDTGCGSAPAAAGSDRWVSLEPAIVTCFRDGRHATDRLSPPGTDDAKLGVSTAMTLVFRGLGSLPLADQAPKIRPGSPLTDTASLSGVLVEVEARHSSSAGRRYAAGSGYPALTSAWRTGEVGRGRMSSRREA